MPAAKLSETGSNRGEEVKYLRGTKIFGGGVTKIAVVLQRNPENQELYIFKEQGRVTGGRLMDDSTVKRWWALEFNGLFFKEWSFGESRGRNRFL